MAKTIDLHPGQELRFIVKQELAQFTVKSGRVEMNMYPCPIDVVISVTGSREVFLLATDRSKITLHSGCQSVYISHKSWVMQAPSIVNSTKFSGRDNNVMVIHGLYHPVFTLAQSISNTLCRLSQSVTMIDLFSRHSAISPATTISTIDIEEPFDSYSEINSNPTVYSIAQDDPLQAHLAKILMNMKSGIDMNRITIICAHSSMNLVKLHDIIPFSTIVCLSGELAHVQIIKAFDPEMDYYPSIIAPEYLPDFHLSADLDTDFAKHYFRGYNPDAPLTPVSLAHQHLSNFTFYKYKVPFTDKSLLPDDADESALTLVEATQFNPSSQDLQDRLYGVLEDRADTINATIVGYVLVTDVEEDQLTLLLPSEDTIPSKNLVWIGVRAMVD